jgi:hypothetical protein
MGCCISTKDRTNRKSRFLRLPDVIMILGILCCQTLRCQETKSSGEFCADPKIKTILLHRAGWDLSMPVILMTDDELLELHFDYMDEPGFDFSYSVVNCTYDWQISTISEHRYLDGFNDVPLYDAEPSRNTTRFYTHYKVTIPGDDLKINMSGNYLLKVYPSSEPENIVFVRRFALVDRKVDIEAFINRPDRENQEILLKVNLDGLKLLNPLEEIKVVILKNNDWNNQVAINQKPLLRDNILCYTLPFQILSPGGNEFRYANLKNTDFASEGVEYVEYRSPEYNFFLKPDKLRQYLPYFNNPDLNGRSFYEAADALDRHLDSDYVRVHFRLESPVPLGTDVYIYGALTDWKADETNYMVYNPDAGEYEAELLIKQGMINYAYATRDYNTDNLNFDITEGNHDETENEYQIFVYLRSITGDFDELVGYTVINSAEVKSR